MSKDRLERRSYRKSPGRQYETDPLRGQSVQNYGYQERSDSPTRNPAWIDSQTDGESGSRTSGRRSSGPLSPRPDPRRTRQLMRQSILASKAKAVLEGGQEEDELDYAELEDEDQEYYERPVEEPVYRSRRPTGPTRGYMPPRERYIDERESRRAERWPEVFAEGQDPDLGYEEEIPEEGFGRYEPARGQRGSQGLTYRPAPEEIEVYEEEEERPRRPRRKEEDRDQEKKRGISRRKLLVGGVVAAGAAVAAYELGPKIPQALQDAGTNVEKQLHDAFQKGVEAGGEAVRKEFVNALDNLEGVSLDAAMGAARLTRVAYDVFISPLITLAATVADDFLSVTLRALITARGWLGQINEDSPTLAALQTVLQSWVDQAHNMPKKLQTITDSDLDGALTYLRGLQRKIQEEQAKLNGQTTPTPTTPGSKTTPTPKS